MFLFGKCLDQKYRNLYLTLEQSFADLKGIVMQDVFATDLDISSLCERFVLRSEKGPMVPREIHFSMLSMPPFWQVVPSYADMGEIQYQGRVRGQVFFKKPFEKHCVDSVAWLDRGIIRRRDYYNRYGNISYSIYFNEKGLPVTKSYYDSNMVEMISYDYDTDSFTTFENGRVKGTYEKKEDFLVRLLMELLADDEQVIVAPLELYQWLVSFEILRTDNCLLVLDSKEDVLAWNECIANRVENKTDPVQRIPKCLVMNNADTNGLPAEYKEKCQLVNYYAGLACNRKKKSALILTMSDQIPSLEDLIREFPDISFHVAANTAVSDKLAALSNYQNAFIYPQIAENELERLLSQCALYLDINNGYEIFDAIATASIMSLVICGYETTLHNRAYVLDECVFRDEAEMKVFLQSIFAGNQLQELRNCQYKKNEKWCDRIKSIVEGEK